MKFRSEQQEKMQRIDERQQEIYKENSSGKRRIRTDEQYREYQKWHVGVKEELDDLKQKKRKVKRQLQLVESIMKEDLYTAYYAVSEDEEIVGDREIEILDMEKQTVEGEKRAVSDIETYWKGAVSDLNVYGNAENDQSDSYDVGHEKMDIVVSEQTQAGENKTKDDAVEDTLVESDKTEWITDRLLSYGVYEKIDVPVKTEIFGFDITDVGGDIRLFSDFIKKL